MPPNPSPRLLRNVRRERPQKDECCFLIDFSLPELNSEFLNKRRSRLRLAVKRLLPDGDKIIMIHERMHQILS